MNFPKNKKLLALCGLIVLLLVGCKPSSERIKVSDATIYYSYFSLNRCRCCQCECRPKGFIIIPFGDGKYFLLDTGLTMSVVFRDRMQIKSAFRRNYAWLNRQRLLPIRNAKSFQIGDLLIENLDFVYMSSENTLFEQDTTIVGIIGMDVFSIIYSYFDMKNQTIIFSNERKNQTKLPSLVLSYEIANRPLVSLCINGIVFENVLFDTGFNDFFILLKSDKEVLNLEMDAEKITNIDFLNNQLSIYQKTPDFIKINDIRFDTPNISYHPTRTSRLLGMEFVRNFSSFLIDPFEKQIKFFE